MSGGIGYSSLPGTQGKQVGYPAPPSKSGYLFQAETCLCRYKLGTCIHTAFVTPFACLSALAPSGLRMQNYIYIYIARFKRLGETGPAGIYMIDWWKRTGGALFNYIYLFSVWCETGVGYLCSLLVWLHSRVNTAVTN